MSQLECSGGERKGRKLRKEGKERCTLVKFVRGNESGVIWVFLFLVENEMGFPLQEDEIATMGTSLAKLF